jgi:hypothetical protein
MERGHAMDAHTITVPSCMMVAITVDPRFELAEYLGSAQLRERPDGKGVSYSAEPLGNVCQNCEKSV